MKGRNKKSWETLKETCVLNVFEGLRNWSTLCRGWFPIKIEYNSYYSIRNSVYPQPHYNIKNIPFLLKNPYIFYHRYLYNEIWSISLIPQRERSVGWSGISLFLDMLWIVIFTLWKTPLDELRVMAGNMEMGTKNKGASPQYGSFNSEGLYEFIFTEKYPQMLYLILTLLSLTEVWLELRPHSWKSTNIPFLEL